MLFECNWTERGSEKYSDIWSIILFTNLTAIQKKNPKYLIYIEHYMLIATVCTFSVFFCPVNHLLAHAHTHTQPPAVVIKGVLDSEMDRFSHPWTHCFFFSTTPIHFNGTVRGTTHSCRHIDTLRFVCCKESPSLYFQKGAKVLMRLLGLRTDREKQISQHAVDSAFVLWPLCRTFSLQVLGY